MRKPTCLLLLVILSAGLASSCRRGDGDTREAGTRLNVLLVTIDTLRADRVGCYGHAAAHTPTLDALAHSGVRFANAFTHVPLTLPSHASLLTGRYPATTGLRVNGAGGLNRKLPTLAELFKGAGYRTGAFIAAIVLDSAYGLDRGFDTYDDAVNTGSAADVDPDHVERRGDVVCDAALKWLAADANKPFFAWVHLFDPHAPYAPPPEFRALTSDAYDGDIAFADAQVHRLVTWLDERKLRDRTLVVAAGDHGEGLGEHGEAQHGYFVYGSTMRVPLIFAGPAPVVAGAVVESGVGLVDVLPTLLELSKIPPPGRLDGRNLTALWQQPPTAGWTVYGESEYPRAGFGWAGLQSLTTERWKYVEAPRAELYDRAADPEERSNVWAQEPQVAADLAARLRKVLAGTEQGAAEAVEVDSAALDRLSALGYVGGTPSPAGVSGSTARDPKDMLPYYQAQVAALGLLQQHEFAAVVSLLEPAAAESPESVEIFSALGTAYLRLGRYADAVRAFTESLKDGAEDARRLTGLGEALRSDGKPQEAMVFLEKALAANADWEPAHRGLASALSQLGRLADALPHWQRCAELNPNSTQVLTNLGGAYLGLGRTKEALPPLQKARRLDPTNEFTYRALWPALARLGQRKDAVLALREGVKHVPGSAELRVALAWLLATTPGTSVPEREEAVALAAAACAAERENARYSDVLAAAYAAAGKFPKALEEVHRAAQLAATQGRHDLLRTIEARTQLYQQGKAYQE
ncbi:MAG: sulfatase-like hydrolase/transferase [Planctomycetes bacterium]|nr:sulfatase-like hydrolase/transferase [Planctomycetota bacterium]